jgi:hypothetical protein
VIAHAASGHGHVGFLKNASERLVFFFRNAFDANEDEDNSGSRAASSGWRIPLEKNAYASR